MTEVNILTAAEARTLSQQARAQKHEKNVRIAMLDINRAVRDGNGRCLTQDRPGVRAYLHDNGYEFWFGATGMLYIKWAVD